MTQFDLTRVPAQDTVSLGGKFSGTTPDGGSIGFTNQSMLRDGVPFFGVSGEVHYCRVSPDQWEDTLIKAKCGGVNMIASYVFWNVHEEMEGRFRFDGCRDLRRFAQLCARHGLLLILRIGPFAHGEMRNGGLPDWLYGKPFEVRNNDPAYLACVRRFFAAIHSQADGLYFSQGGPIVGVQLENEYMHSSAPWEITTGAANEWVNGGQDGEEHIRVLKRIAREEGIVTPFYTCTAWGGGMAPTDEVLPLWGGYAYRPWIFYQRTGEHPCTPEYIYRRNHSNDTPATYNFEPRYQPESVPYACCEMMGGMMCSYNYRFTLPGEAVDALANIKLGSGCAMLGYYMYRGGTTPTGERAPFLNEGQICKRSYDYQAPIGEFGDRRASYYRLRTLHELCARHRELLLGGVTVLPQGQPELQPEDTAHLRCCVRVKGSSGFLFVNDFQDHLPLPDRQEDQVTLRLPGEELTFAISLASGENAILPFNLPVGDQLLKKATVQPITSLTLEGVRCHFFMIPRGMKPVLRFASCTLTPPADGISCHTVGEERIILLPRREAMRFSHMVMDGRDMAFLSDTGLLWDGASLRLETDGTPQQVQVWRDGDFRQLPVTVPAVPEIPLQPEQVGPSRWKLSIPAQALRGHKTVLLRVDYLGNIGQAFIDGDMISDNFCNGTPWEIRVDCERERLAAQPLTLYIVPIKKGASVTADTTMAARMEHVAESAAVLERASLRFVDEITVDVPD